MSLQSTLRRKAGRFLINVAREVLPAQLKHEAQRPKTRAASAPTARQPQYCPICGFQGVFKDFGRTYRRPRAQCPKCGSLERHRLLKRATDGLGVELAGKSMLHFAPEPAVRQLIEPTVGRYVTTEYAGGDVDLTLNIEAIDLPDEAFDALVCFHVLEHVDDAKALPELYRILTPGGIALLATPIVEAWEASYEDPSIIDPELRLLHFGQDDHVRVYGRDIRQRIKDAGFDLVEYMASGAECVRYGLQRGETIFIATKPNVEAD